MTEAEFSLSRARRDEIMRAAKAIERQVKELADKTDRADWGALWVIGTNLTIIHTNLTDLPRVSSN